MAMRWCLALGSFALMALAVACGGTQTTPTPVPAATLPPFDIVLNTGYDQAAEVEIAYGTSDDDWDLVTWVETPTLSYGSNVTYGCGMAAYSASTPPPGPSTPSDAIVVLSQDWSQRWSSVLAGPDSRWVSTDQRGRPGVAPLEEFVWAFEFTLPQGATNIVLVMDIYADQAATVTLNGNLIGTVPDWPVQASQGPTSISTSDASHFQAGTNLLEVEVTEAGAYSLNSGCGIVTGFNIAGSVSGLGPPLPTPTPTLAAITAIALTPVVASTEPLRCPRGETEIQTVFRAGVNDGYGPDPDTPAAAPSAGLDASITRPLLDFDQLAWDRWFAHTFVGLPTDMVSAELEIGLMSWGEGPENDSISLRFTDQGGNLTGIAWTSRIGSPGGLLPQSWPTYNQFTFFLDLSQLPPQGTSLLADLNASGFLDVVVQDDTRVDYVNLSVTVCGMPATPTPTPLSVAGTPFRVTPTPTATPLSVVGAVGTPFRATPTPTAIPRPTSTPTPTATPRPSPTPTVTPTKKNPDLEIKKSLNGEFHYGGTGSYTLLVGNVGAGTAMSPITVVDVLPDGFTFDSYSDPFSTDWACAASGQQVTCTYTGPDISPGGFLPTLIINVTIDPIDRFPGGSDAVENCAQVRHPDDADPGNDQSCVTVIITPASAGG